MKAILIMRWHTSIFLIKRQVFSFHNEINWVELKKELLKLGFCKRRLFGISVKRNSN